MSTAKIDTVIVLADKQNKYPTSGESVQQFRYDLPQRVALLWLAILWGMWWDPQRLLCEQPLLQERRFELSQYGIQVNGTLPNVHPEAI